MEVRHEKKSLIEKAVEADCKVNKTETSKLQERLIIVYGDIELSTKERKFLSLGPYFPLMESLDRKTAAQDFLRALTKVR